MAKRPTHELAFTALRIEGGLLAPDFLDKIAHLDATEQSEADYDIPRGLKLRDEIGRYWKIAQNLWHDFDAARGRTDRDPHTLTAQDFLEPFCRQVLGMADLKPVGQIVLDERVFPIGFVARDGQLATVFAAHNQELDKPSPRHGDGTRRRSPFLLAQEYLNADERCLWAVVSNGLKLRILRDNPSLTRPAYIEADLEAIFTEGLYPDFTALWLLAHGTRFGKAGAEPADCPLERWRNTAQEEGIRVRDRLRNGVTEALRSLGTGFLAHAANNSLRQKLEAGELTTQALFEQLLRLVYRFIFLATIEDRDLVFAPDASADAKQRYQAGYSLARLRNLAARRRSYDRHSDLWQVLTITFAGLGKGQPALGLPALGGLFDTRQCPDLDGAQLDNQSLLSALFSLCFFREAAALSRVNYRDMDSEELGSVYESLLELVPVVTLTGGVRRFGFVGDDEAAATRGHARKLTGSYYTPDSLVQELIKSALEPVIEQILKANPQAPVQALLDLTVCDPACGSGHFLLAAARRIAEEVARLSAADGNPTPDDYRHALRDVVAHCVYGVDKNPMAIELARTALWLEAYTPDRPLTFLEHHLRCGDALLGVLDLAILEEGIPDKAFNGLSGDDKDVVKALKKANREARKGIEKIRKAGPQQVLELTAPAYAIDIDALPDATLADIEVKRAAFARVEAAAAHSRERIAADLFVAAFVLPKTEETQPTVPTSQDLYLQLTGNEPRPGVAEAASSAAQAAQAFHWWQAFPHVHEKDGFDVLLGNPPWERIKLQEEEFFSTRSSLVAEAQHKAERGKRIELLKDGMLLHTLYPDVEAAQGLRPPNRAEQQLHAEFLMARRGAEAASLFAHDAGRYPLTGVGDVNTYALFAETFAQLVAPQGRAGFIVPTGIATDDSTKAFFSDVVTRGMLARLLSLYEIRGWFKDTDDRKSFCLFTLGKAEAAEFLFDAKTVNDFHEPEKWFRLTPDEFRLINPNTRTCPVFRSERDAELTKKLYRAAPVLIEEGKDEKNPWGMRFMAMIHMSNDSHLFHDAPGPGRLPLYEAKMIHQFDHRWATYGADGSSRDVTEAEKADPDFTVTPRYWVDARVVWLKISRLPKILLDPLRNGQSDLVVLSVAILMFFRWLRERYRGQTDQCVAHLYSEWRAFIVQFPYARDINPIQTGAGGDNPTCFKPLDGSYLPCAPIDKIVTTEHKRTGWVAADPRMVTALMSWSDNFPCDIDLTRPIDSQDEALALAERWLEESCPRWLMGWRDIALRSVERTVITSVVPRVGVGHTMPLMFTDTDARVETALLGNLDSLVLDFVARVKVGGTHLTYSYLKQFPILPPERYEDADLAFIVPRVLELTYTAHDLKPWADDLGYAGPPFPWNPERRAILRAELDAYYAKLYGLTRDELRYILDPADVMGDDYPSETFRVLKNNEIRQFGEYRTQRLVMREFDRMALADATGEPYISLLVPPPGQSAQPSYSPHGVMRDQVDACLAGLLLTIIRQAERMPRQQFTYALTIAGQAGSMQAFVSSDKLDQLSAYQRQHASIFEESRISGDRLQTMLRYFETNGAIRIEQKGTWLVAVSPAALPAGLVVEADTSRVADILLRAAKTAMESGAAADDGREIDRSERAHNRE